MGLAAVRALAAAAPSHLGEPAVQEFNRKQFKRKFHMSRDFSGPDSGTPLENSLQKLADMRLAQCKDPPLVNAFIT